MDEDASPNTIKMESVSAFAERDGRSFTQAVACLGDSQIYSSNEQRIAAV
jgi:hypothetical protein